MDTATMASEVIENTNPNFDMPAASTSKLQKVRSKKKVLISPKKPTIISPRRQNGSHFARSDEQQNEDDIAWNLANDSSEDENPKPRARIEASKNAKISDKTRRRRRSSARFLRLSDRFDGAGNTDGSDNIDSLSSNDGSGIPEGEEELTSSEHLGEIYRQAIRLNAENKINAGNSWGLKLIENMDKFIEEDGTGASTPRTLSSEDVKATRKQSKDERGRINFTKASCALDASVKIYSYRVDDVHLSSYRVLANLNRTDNKKDDEGGDVLVDETLDGDGEAKTVSRKKNSERKGNGETIETNLANINMSKLDSAYDIDPLFHKMSKAFDEGGAKGLLLGNLGVSKTGCHIVFESKEESDIDGGFLGKDADAKRDAEVVKKHEDNMNNWKESEIDITSLAGKLDSMLLSYGVESSDSVPFVPQLESLRSDYAALEEEGFAVDEKDATGDGRRRLRLYDAPDEEEKEAEKSIHHNAMERSRGSVLGMSFDTNFKLSLDSAGKDDGDLSVMADEENLSLGGDGEFAPVDFDHGEDDFTPEFSSQGGHLSETFGEKRSYSDTKVLLDALCDGDIFHDDRDGNNSDYAYFDVEKFERATDGNLWAGSQHWKKVPSTPKNENSEIKKVTFHEYGEVKEDIEKKKRTTKKDRMFVDLTKTLQADNIFLRKTSKAKRNIKSTDPFQLTKTEKGFLLPPDANVGSSELTRLFSRPNAVVLKPNRPRSNKGTTKTVGFHDIDDNALGFDRVNEFSEENDSGGFIFTYGENDGDPGDDVDYHADNFDEVRKVQKINVNYATVAKKVDVRRLKRDLWAELEKKTSPLPPHLDPVESSNHSDVDETHDEIFTECPDSRLVSFKETVENLERAQTQHDVTLSFYFICCLHLANEKGLKLESTGLDDFMISMDDGKLISKEIFDALVETLHK